MPSFDIVCKVDLQELDNAVNSVLRELTNRYDFKGADFSLKIEQKENQVKIHAPDEYKLSQIGDSLKVYCTKRNIDTKSLEFEDPQQASHNSFRQNIKIKQGIDSEIAKKVIKFIKDKKLKVQASIRGEEVRVEGKKLDELQDIIAQIKSAEFDLPLQFINFRS